MKIDYEFFPFFNFKKECKLSYTSRLIYSWLSYRDRLKIEETTPQLKKTFHLRRDLKKSIQELVNHKLLNERTLQPIEPFQDWISKSKLDQANKHWSLKFMSFKHYYKKPEYHKYFPQLTNKQVTILSILEDFSRQERLVNWKGVATILDLDWKTIRNAALFFEISGLINIKTSEKGKYFITLTQSCDKDKVQHFITRELEYENKDNPQWINRLIFENISEVSLSRVKRLANELKDLTPNHEDDIKNIMVEVINQFDPENFKSWTPLFEKYLENWVNKLTAVPV